MYFLLIKELAYEALIKMNVKTYHLGGLIVPFIFWLKYTVFRTHYLTQNVLRNIYRSRWIGRKLRH